ncbi:MAG: arginase [Rhodospirillales bacterium]|nr:arginase [Rhodospirillales bacterium]
MDQNRFASSITARLKHAVDLIGAPIDIGAQSRGCSMAPEALRIAGIRQRLEGLGLVVSDKGNLRGPHPLARSENQGYQHLMDVAEWCEMVRGAVVISLQNGKFPVVLGGDHSLAIGSVCGVAKVCQEKEMPLSVLWLDAHADFNTAETSSSGNIHGMPVAVLANRGAPELIRLGHKAPVIDTSNLFQVGIRSIDLLEREAVIDEGIAIFDMRCIDERGMHAVMKEVLSSIKGIGGHLHVSFDVDFLDPTIAPGVGTPVPGGTNYREAQLCMEMIYDSGMAGSLDIVELNPTLDTKNATAEVVVDLVASLFGEQILARGRTPKNA